MKTHSADVSPTRSFSMVFLIEMWERFDYYGMTALLVLFMVDKIGFADDHANLTWGAFTTLFFPHCRSAGESATRCSARRTMTIGAIVLALGYFMLALPIDTLGFLYASRGMIVVGNGLFKSNAANFVRRIYYDEGDDARIDSAFTIYYMAVNIGSTFSMLATPWIKDHWGWHVAFAVCCGGMALGLVNFAIMRRTLGAIGSASDDLPMNWPHLVAVLAGGTALAAAMVFILQHKAVAVSCVYAAGVAILGIFGYMLKKCNRGERAGLVAALILTLQVILFFVFYQQMSTSADVDFPHAIRAARRRSTVFDRGLRSGLRGAPSSFRRSIRSGRRRGGLLRVCDERPPCSSERARVVVVHGSGLRALFAGQTARVRPRTRDDRALRAGSHERLHDGRVFRRDRRVVVPRQRGDELREDTVGQFRSAAIAAAVHASVLRARLARGGRGRWVAIALLPLLVGGCRVGIIGRWRLPSLQRPRAMRRANACSRFLRVDDESC